MKTTQIATVLLVGLGVVGLAFVGPAAAHAGASTPTTDSTWNDSSWTANDTHRNGPASTAGTAQWQWMVEQFGHDRLPWMSPYSGDRHPAWSTDAHDGTPNAGPWNGHDRGVRGPGNGMHGSGTWSADQSARQPGQQFGIGPSGSTGEWGGYGC